MNEKMQDHIGLRKLGKNESKNPECLECQTMAVSNKIQEKAEKNGLESECKIFIKEILGRNLIYTWRKN